MAVREEGVETLGGVGAKTAEAMIAAGIKTVGDVAATGTDGLTEVGGIGPKTAAKIFAAAQEVLAASVPEVADEPEEQAAAAIGLEVADVAVEAETEIPAEAEAVDAEEEVAEDEAVDADEAVAEEEAVAADEEVAEEETADDAAAEEDEDAAA